MPSQGLTAKDDPAGAPIDFVLGDNFGRAAATEYMEAAKQSLREMGYVVAVNDPYPGGHVTKAYGAPEAGVHVLQVEVNRALYMDETTYEPAPNFPRLREDLTRLMAALAGV